MHLVKIDQRRGPQVYPDRVSGNKGKNVVRAGDSLCLSPQTIQADARLAGDQSTDGLLCWRRYWRGIGPQIIFQELNVPLPDPADTGLRAETVIKPILSGELFSRWTPPAPYLVALITLRTLHRQSDQSRFRFALFITGRVGSQHKVIWRVDGADAPSILSRIVQFD